MLWASSLRRHDAVLTDYLPFELDPQVILTCPAALDVQVPETRASHEASATASALRTESGPADAGHGQAYASAVSELEAAWTEAKRHALEVGLDYLQSGEVRDRQRISGLLQHADATTGAESQSSRQRAAEILAALPPRGTEESLGTLRRAVRGELPRGTTD
ncbi:hypothetical protein [Gordonia sp. VNK21]|uniref:hypothetical protein n=1 Tax=Gordonia sp. VNK21 TaxID=3382483 RepID=UPI0038D50C86